MITFQTLFFWGFLVNSLSAKGILGNLHTKSIATCESRTESEEKPPYLFLNNAWFGYW